MKRTNPLKSNGSWRPVVLLSVWIFLIGVGFWKLLNYSNTPGDLAQAHAHWPTGTLLSRNANQPVLVVFAHPHCPCSNASVGELERLIPYTQGKVKSFVVFVKPKGKPETWVTKAKLWKKAQAIPTVETYIDSEGAEVHKFGARTSGQTFLYDAQGTLVFRGGITPERGHMGDSAGREAILQFVATGVSPIESAPVFGCSLKRPERARTTAGEIK